MSSENFARAKQFDQSRTCNMTIYNNRKLTPSILELHLEWFAYKNVNFLKLLLFSKYVNVVIYSYNVNGLCIEYVKIDNKANAKLKSILKLVMSEIFKSNRLRGYIGRFNVGCYFNVSSFRINVSDCNCNVPLLNHNLGCW